MSIHFVTNEQLYKQAIEPFANATSFVWTGTADIKDLHVHRKGNVPSFLSVLDNLENFFHVITKYRPQQRQII
jgi:hypothetical protein